MWEFFVIPAQAGIQNRESSAAPAHTPSCGSGFSRDAFDSVLRRNRGIVFEILDPRVREDDGGVWEFLVIPAKAGI